MLFLLPAAATATPDEASGTVVGVVDGKTFEVRIEKFDPRIGEGVERVALADVELPEEPVNESMNEPMIQSNESMDESGESANRSISEETSAKDLAVAILLNKTVWLDIDDRSDNGRNADGDLVAVLYLSGLDGKPVISPSFNRMLVDYRIAEMNDSLANEFDPADWWPPQENGSRDNAGGEEKEEDGAGAKTSGLNIDINPAKPEVNVNLSRPKVKISPAKPKVKVNLTGLNIKVNPTKPSINVNPRKPVIDVNPENATENETDAQLSSNETLPGTNNTATVQSANFSEPVVLKNTTAPITLLNPTGLVTVINSTGQVKVIDPAKPVKVINSTETETEGELNDTKIATKSTELTTLTNFTLA
ncbi:MAG: hypothetical protein ACP5EL_01055 [Methanocrinis sp.]